MSEKTIVVFRKWPNGDILALMPADTADHRGNVTCYEHVGQHGAADYPSCIARTKPATPAEYASLKRELESAPYNYRFKVQRRYTR